MFLCSAIEVANWTATCNSINLSPRIFEAQNFGEMTRLRPSPSMVDNNDLAGDSSGEDALDAALPGVLEASKSQPRQSGRVKLCPKSKLNWDTVSYSISFFSLRGFLLVCIVSLLKVKPRYEYIYIYHIDDGSVPARKVMKIQSAQVLYVWSGWTLNQTSPSKINFNRVAHSELLRYRLPARSPVGELPPLQRLPWPHFDSLKTRRG